MPALSQALTFIVTNVPNVPTSGAIPQTQVSYPAATVVNGLATVTRGDPITYYSQSVVGDGYHRGGLGLHTVTYGGQNLTATIIMQGTLASEPAEEDWFDIPESSVTFVGDMSSTVKGQYVNFTGNFVYLRAKLTLRQGTLANILYNH